MEIGAIPESFELPDTRGVAHALTPREGDAAVLVVWTCNHCPYAIAWHDRLAKVAADYAERGLRTVMVNSNDAERYPRDSLDAMRERVEEEGWEVPYLHDASQDAARSWGAKTTPDCFLLDSDGALVYRGAPDADYEDPALDAGWLRDAVDAVLGNRAPELAETEPVGCSIKWA